MKKVLYFLTAFFLFITFAENASSQIKTVNDGTYIPITTHKRKPVPYQYVREADVLWSKVVWRKIILTEKSNHALYYPTIPMQDRKSLFQLMMHGIDKTVFYPYKTDDNFEVSYTQEEINENLGAVPDTMPVLDENGDEMYDADGEPITKIIAGERKYGEVKELIIKEMWFFDKQRSVMEARVIALCPVRVYEDPNDPTAPLRKKKVFWVLYQEARNLFATQAIYNENNQASTNSFDDVFFKRQFDGFIEQESNIYENRLVNEYTSSGTETMLVSEDIKNEIFDYEHDMWEF